MSLGKDISRLVSRGDGEQLKISFLEMLASDVAVDFNMLGAFVEDIIMSNVDSIMIVTIKRSGSGLCVRLNLINHVLALFRDNFACNIALRNPVFRWVSCKGSV